MRLGIVPAHSPVGRSHQDKEFAMPRGKDAEFVYSPDQPPTTDQRIEVLELQVADMREQLEAVVEQLGAIDRQKSSRGLT